MSALKHLIRYESPHSGIPARERSRSRPSFDADELAEPLEGSLAIYIDRASLKSV